MEFNIHIILLVRSIRLLLNLRILKKQGVVLKGVANEIYPLDRQLFEVIGTGVEQSGTVMAPAYVRESETGDDVLVRGTMTIS